MLAFHAMFPEISERETRSVVVRAHPELPDGSYAFIEHYCTESDCDCRRVLLWIVDEDINRLATINHAFDPPPYEAERDLLDQTFLDPMNPQSEYSASLLEFFEDTVLDTRYQTRLEQHYALVKEAISDPEHPVQELLAQLEKPRFSSRRPVRRKQKKIGRNDPCPCGSGKKYKKCCLAKSEAEWS